MAIALGLLEDIVRGVFWALSSTVIRIFSALLIFLIGFILGKVLGRLVSKGLEELELNNFLKDTLHLKVNAEHLISMSISYMIYFLSLIAAMEQIGIANIVLYVISILFVLMVIVSFFLAAKDFVPNFIAGFYLYSKEHLRPGNEVEINDIKGELIHIDLLHIKVKTPKGDLIYIPNSAAANSNIRLKKSKANSKPQA